jgi:hypothetical protein
MQSTTNTKAIADDSRGDEVMIAFAEAGTTANAADWMRRHPEFAGEIARYAADRWVGEPTGVADAEAVARLRAIGRETVRSCRVQAGSAAAAAAPLASLIAAAKVRGLDPQALAAQLEVPYALLFKLHRRLIAPASVPRNLVRSLAESLGRTADEITAYLRQPATLAYGASYRADDAPTVGGQESFADALRSDPEATDAQRVKWLNGGDNDSTPQSE